MTAPKENAQGRETEGAYQQKEQRQFIRSPRQVRVLQALLGRSITRKECDAIARASNGPDVIFGLRGHGLQVETTLVDCQDFDGKPSRFARYWLPDAERPRARELLGVR